MKSLTEPQPTRMSFEEYLRFDADYDRPVEYVAGIAYPRNGRSKRHNRININIALPLHDRAEETGCHAFMAQMRTRVADDTICYPDVVVTCDPSDTDEWTVFRPCLIAEVVSLETEAIDRGAKRDAYLGMPSLRCYLVVSEAERFVERHWRETESANWQSEVILDETILVPVPGIMLTVEQIYRNLPQVGEQ